MRPVLALTLLAFALPEWQAGSFHGVVTGQSRLEAARGAFGTPINDVVDDRDDRLRRITFRPLTVSVPATDGGIPFLLLSASEFRRSLIDERAASSGSV